MQCGELFFHAPVGFTPHLHFSQHFLFGQQARRQAVIEIVQQETSPAEMRRKIIEALTVKPKRSVRFYQNEKPNRVLREAPKKFQTTRSTLARLIGIHIMSYSDFASGLDPVSPKRLGQIQAMEEASTLSELRERLARLPPVRPPASGRGIRLSPAEAARRLETYMARYQAQVLRQAGYGLRRFGLNSKMNREEVAQDVFVVLHAALRDGRLVEETVEAWLNRVARR